MLSTKRRRVSRRPGHWPVYEICPVLSGRVVQQLMSRYDRVQLGADVRHLDTDYSRGRLAMKHYNWLTHRHWCWSHSTPLILWRSSLSLTDLQSQSDSVRFAIVGKFWVLSGHWVGPARSSLSGICLSSTELKESPVLSSLLTPQTPGLGRSEKISSYNNISKLFLRRPQDPPMRVLSFD